MKIDAKIVEENTDKRNQQEQLWNQLKSTNTLMQIQQYIQNENELRGFTEQPIQDTMLLLTEEVGELAKAIRKQSTDMRIDANKSQNYDTIQSEVADVFYVLCSICNKVNVDLFQAIKEKEKENVKRTWTK